MMNTAFHPHRGFLDAYDVQILNNADHLEPILRDRGILDRVSTVFSIGIGAGHLECQLARELGFSLALNCYKSANKNEAAMRIHVFWSPVENRKDL